MINGKVLNGITKTVGAVGLGLTVYNSHAYAKIHASAYEKEHKAESLAHHYLEDMKIDTPSVVKSRMKEGILHYRTDENMSGFFKTIGGYVRGFSTMAIGSVVPLALSLGTLLGGKGLFSKFCGAGLLAYGGIILLQDGLGIGKPKE